MATGTFTNHPTLIKVLPPLVRKQRTLAAKIAVVAQDVQDEKAVRADIDALLVAAGLQKGEGVTCNGYDVKHNERDGQARINGDVLTEQLAAAGVDRTLIGQTIGNATETSKPSAFCTVTPTKGAKVRA
jgi:hypothetical protein